MYSLTSTQADVISLAPVLDHQLYSTIVHELDFTQQLSTSSPTSLYSGLNITPSHHHTITPAHHPTSSPSHQLTITPAHPLLWNYGRSNKRLSCALSIVVCATSSTGNPNPYSQGRNSTNYQFICTSYYPRISDQHRALFASWVWYLALYLSSKRPASAQEKQEINGG